MQGVFHPAYRDLQRSAGLLLGQRNLTVFKGGGGEAERNPDKPCRVFSLQDGAAFDEEWPPLVGAQSSASQAAVEEHPLIACWRGEMPDEARIVVATAAIALRTLGRAASIAEADDLAMRMWEARDRSRYPRATVAQRPKAAAG
jgi:anthranilate phosphoribosyltransferase